MNKIDFHTALKYFKDNKEVYLLYDDNSEGLAETIEDLYQHHIKDGEFGIEK